MLVDMSSKFRASPQAPLHEPRAVLILNRFTRTLTIMYATNSVASILGFAPEQLKNKSLYECIQENCVPEAVRCLESAKANDSIVYLRFWHRDPRRDEDFDEEMRRASQNMATSDQGEAPRSSTSTFLVPNPHSRRRGLPHLLQVNAEAYEIEAIISCTSDGLVVVMRRGRPVLPSY